MSGPYDGSRGDAFIYKHSALAMMSRLIKGPGNVQYHLYGTVTMPSSVPLYLGFTMGVSHAAAGDKAYAISDVLIRPFKNPMTPPQRTFNR